MSSGNPNHTKPSSGGGGALPHPPSEVRQKPMDSSRPGSPRGDASGLHPPGSPLSGSHARTRREGMGSSTTTTPAMAPHVVRGGPMRADGAEGVPRGGSVCRTALRSSTLGSSSTTTHPNPGSPTNASTTDRHITTPPPPPPQQSGQPRRASFVDLGDRDEVPRMVRGHSGYLAQPRGGPIGGGIAGSLPASTHAAPTTAGTTRASALAPARAATAAAHHYGYSASASPLTTSLGGGLVVPGYTPGSAYSVRLDGDSGGVEMAMARGRLAEALRLRGGYHSALQPQQYARHVAASGPGTNPHSLPPPPPPPFQAATVNLRMDDGVFVFGDVKAATAAPAVPWERFYDDFAALAETIYHPACQSACRYRLEVLEEKFSAYKLSNSEIEIRDPTSGGGGGSGAGMGGPSSAAGGGVGAAAGTGAAGARRGRAMAATSVGMAGSPGSGVFSDCCKVDNGVLFPFMMSPQALVDFIQEAVEVRGEEDVVAFMRSNDSIGIGGVGGGGAAGEAVDYAQQPQQLLNMAAAGPSITTGAHRGPTNPSTAAANANGGEPITLQHMCEMLGFRESHHITVDALGIQPSGERPMPYYNPLDPTLNSTGPSSAALLRVFLSKDTLNGGDYLAQLVRPCLARNEVRTRAPQATETVVEITGLIPDEWARTALWLKGQQLLGDAGSGNAYRNNRYVVAFPRYKIVAMAAAARAGGGTLGGSSGADGMASGAAMGSGDVAAGHAFLAAANTGAATPIIFEHHQQHIDSLFLPLFLATIAPEDPHNGAVADLLAHVGALAVVPLENNFSCGDGDSDGAMSSGRYRMSEHKRTRPADVPWTETVSDLYFMYYVWANLCSLNALRRMRGLNTLQLRTFAVNDGVVGGIGGGGGSGFGGGGVPSQAHRGGDLASGVAEMHQLPVSLLCSYLLADHIYNGLGLTQLPVLQYLFCLRRIGVCMSPLSCNALGMTGYTDHPFPRFFRRGLRVSLVTFAPLLFHHSATDPLLEEYGTASKIYRMSGVDVCEVALNSVLISSFPDTDAPSLHATGASKYGFSEDGANPSLLAGATGGGATKAAWLGEAFIREGWRGNIYALSNVPTARLAMREELWMAEMEVVHKRSGTTGAAGKSAGSGAAALTTAHTNTNTHGAGEENATTAMAPFLVTDPRTHFPRVTFVGPYHRETQHAIVAQHLHRALELRRMYVRSSYRSSAGSALSAGGGFGVAGTLASAVATAAAFGAGMSGGGGGSNSTGGSGGGFGFEGRSKADILNMLTNLGTDSQNANLVEYLAYLIELYRSSGGAAMTSLSATAASLVTANGIPLTPQQLQSRGLEAAFHRKGGGASAATAATGKPPLADEDDEDDDFDESEWMFKTVEGVVVPHEVHQIPRLPQDMFHYDDFCAHVEEIRAMGNDAHIRSFAARRLRMLENRFMLHTAVNHSLEAGSTADKASQNRDLYQSTKVDCTVRMEAGMPARLLLDFIIDKARNNGDDIVSHEKAREPQTLRQLLKELDISPETLTVDDLEVQVDPTLDWGSGGDDPESEGDTNGPGDGADPTGRPKHSRRRGRDILLSLLLRTDNQMNGRYFAELTKRTFENLGRDRFTFTESRLRVYGASSDEWAQLSTWFDTHGMGSARNQWMVEVPRSYAHWRRQGKVRHFAEFLENIFTPLWAVSLHPSRDPRLFHFLNHISAFDCVAAGGNFGLDGGGTHRGEGGNSNSSNNGGGSGNPDTGHGPKAPLSHQPLGSLPPPHEWDSEEDPPFNYYLYHLWANITSLNAFRRRRKFSQFAFRPSCGEAGPVDHLIGGFLLANSITYGVELRSSAVLQYLYYLARIGIVMCPLSNNASAGSAGGVGGGATAGMMEGGSGVGLSAPSDSLRASTLQQNPFPVFFKRGLCVTLGTDCPLKYHHTQEPLVEEYSIASKMWKLSPTDMCEIARTSVLVSGFSSLFKMQRLGELFFLSSSAGNDTGKTHLSDVRLGYRFEAYHSEIGYLEYVSGQSLPKAMLTLKEEEAILGLLNSVKEQSKARHRQLEQQHPPQVSGEAASKRVAFAEEGNYGVGGNIIDATPDAAELDRLQARRAQMRRQVEELAQTVAELQRRNHQLTTKLYEEKERDQQAALLRRQHLEGRLTMTDVKSTYGEQMHRVFGEGLPAGSSLASQLQQPLAMVGGTADGLRPLPPLPADAVAAAAGVLDLPSTSSSITTSATTTSKDEGGIRSAGSGPAGKPAPSSASGSPSASVSASATVGSGKGALASTAAPVPHPGALLHLSESLWSRATTYPAPGGQGTTNDEGSAGGLGGVSAGWIQERSQPGGGEDSLRLPVIRRGNPATSG